MSTNAGKKPGPDEPASGSSQETSQESQTNNLTVRYGAIGISAVAAALRYTVVAKNPAYAPVVQEIDFERIEMAA